MNKPKTRIAIVLDKSGSMAHTKDKAIQGLNEQIQQAKERAKDQDLRCSFVTFNGEVFEHLWDVPAEKLIEANPDDYKPSGSTAYLDAVGYTVQKLLATETEQDKDTAYLVYCISDGDTNADMHYNKSSLNEIIQGVEGTGRWTITFMGHDKEKLKQLAHELGVPISNTAMWSNSTDTLVGRAFNNQKLRSAKFFDERSLGKMSSASYSASADCCSVADYTEQAPSMPVEVDMNTVKIGTNVNLDELLARQPKYTNVEITPQQMNADGTVPLFSNNIGVVWTK